MFMLCPTNLSVNEADLVLYFMIFLTCLHDIAMSAFTTPCLTKMVMIEEANITIIIICLPKIYSVMNLFLKKRSRSAKLKL